MADLAGRSARWIRPNIKLLFLSLFIPQLVYHIAWEAYMWILENQGVDSLLSAMSFVLAACLMVMMFILYEIGARCVAFWYLLLGKESDFRFALRRARRGALLLVFLPMVLNDLFVAAPTSFMLIVIAESNKLGHAGRAVGYDLAVIFGFLLLLLWTVPYKIIFIANLSAAFTILARDESITSGLGKLVFFASWAPWMVLWALILFGFIAGLIEMPEMIVVVFEELIKQFLSLDRTILTWLGLIIRVTTESLFSILSLAFVIGAAALFDNELRIRLEGQDIVDRLHRIKSR